MLSLVEYCIMVLYHLDGLEVVDSAQGCRRRSYNQRRSNKSPQLQLEEDSREPSWGGRYFVSLS